jgi:hypothetical protein
MALINKTGITDGGLIEAEHITRIIDALTSVSTDTIVATGSFQGTLDGTAALANTASYITTAQTASYILNAVSASFATSASRSTTSSFSLVATSASFASNAFGATSASFASNAFFGVSASYADNSVFSVSASLAQTAKTASYVLNAVSASFATTASFVLGGATVTSASFATSASQAISSSRAITASFATTAATASFIVTAQTASFVTTAQTASYVLNAVSASFATSASRAISASIATSASFAINSLTTASVSSNTITFTKGDGTTFPITVDTGSAGSSAGYVSIVNQSAVSGSVGTTETVLGSVIIPANTFVPGDMPELTMYLYTKNYQSSLQIRAYINSTPTNGGFMILGSTSTNFVNISSGFSPAFEVAAIRRMIIISSSTVTLWPSYTQNNNREDGNGWGNGTSTEPGFASGNITWSSARYLVITAKWQAAPLPGDFIALRAAKLAR